MDLETHRVYHILEQNSEDEPLGIRENDIVSFWSFVNALNIKLSSYTLEQVKIIIEKCEDKESFFPDYIPNETFEL